jgi:exodeoxyribonuclease V gamma subunit
VSAEASRVAPDFRLYHGNDLAVLAGILAHELAKPAPGQPLLAPETILIPQPAMRRWLQKHLAETHGIAANLRFLAPGEFVRDALKANLPSTDDEAVGEAAVLRWRLWRLLADPALLRERVFAPLRPLLETGGALAPWTLAGELAAAFEKYQAWRRDWLRRWDHGGDKEDWQAELWRRATRGLSHRGRRLDAYLSKFDGDDAAAPSGLPGRVFAFACQNVSPDVLRVIASAARAGTLHFFFLSPVQGWWGDLRSARERLREDPAAVFDDDEHPLLRANGAAGRDFVRTLFSYEVVHPTWEQPVYAPPAREGLLQRLQRDLLARRKPSEVAPVAFDRADASLQFHNCHTRLREVQVLHARLRALLESDPTLQPRDIAVLTPDMDRYAPFVHAVFGADSNDRHAIPYAIGDAGLLASQSAAEAFLRLLDLPGARFGANEVLDLLAVKAVAERYELEPAELGQVRDWLEAAGVRWGLDAKHKAELDAPPEAAFSWAWGLDRLLLGHAAGHDADIADVAPLPLLEGAALDLLDRVLQALRRLAQWRTQLTVARTPLAWSQALARLLDDFFPERARHPADRDTVASLRARVATVARQAERAQLEADVPYEVVRAWLREALAEDDARQPFLTGGVTFGRMVPMRLVPFRVIALLGLSDGEFPRRDPPASLNRLVDELQGAHRRAGDRSVRDDDRGLFLQLFAAAGDALLLSYLGQDPRSGETLPPSVVVSELLETAAAQFTDADAARAALVVKHPLQPFVAAGERRAPPPFAAGVPEPEPPPDAAPVAEWTREQLVRALCHPPREFLCERLGLRLPEGSERLPEEEPFASNDGLGQYALDQRLFALKLQQPLAPHDALARRLLAEGRIAPAAAGRLAMDESLARIAPALAAWQAADGGPPLTLPYTLEWEGLRLSGTLPHVYADGLRQFSPGRGHGRNLIALGVDVLAWSALGEARPVLRVVRDGGHQVIAPMPVAQARAKLRQLLALATRARREPLPFMPKAGALLVCADDEAEGLRDARQAWLNERGGEGHDAWVRLALRGAMPFDDAQATDALAALAHAIFLGLPGGLPCEDAEIFDAD